MMMKIYEVRDVGCNNNCWGIQLSISIPRLVHVQFYVCGIVSG